MLKPLTALALGVALCTLAGCAAPAGDEPDAHDQDVAVAVRENDSHALVFNTTCYADCMAEMCDSYTDIDRSDPAFPTCTLRADPICTARCTTGGGGRGKRRLPIGLTQSGN